MADFFVDGSLWSYPGRNSTGSASARLTEMPFPVATTFSWRRPGNSNGVTSNDSSLLVRSRDPGRLAVAVEQLDGEVDRRRTRFGSIPACLLPETTISDVGRGRVDRGARGDCGCGEDAGLAEVRRCKRRFTVSREPASLAKRTSRCLRLEKPVGDAGADSRESMLPKEVGRAERNRRGTTELKKGGDHCAP